MDRNDVGQRTELLGDFHVVMAEQMGNHVLAQLLGDLISRCALITLMYQSTSAAEHSHESTKPSSLPWRPKTKTPPCA